MLDKKSQISIFIIIAIIILLVVGLFYLYISNKNKPEISKEELPEDFKPIQLYIENCMQSVGQEATIKIGQHGGYIDPLDSMLSLRSFDYDIKRQYNSDLAFLNSEDISSAVAYWYYSAQSNYCDNCIAFSQAPSLELIEYQISTYTDNLLPECLKEFTSFKDKGFIIEYSNETFTTVTLTDSKIVLETEFNISIEKDNNKVRAGKFYTEINIPLKKYYLMAVSMTVREITDNYLENLLIYLVSAYSGLNSEKLPPFYEETEGYDITFWSQAQVKENIISLLSSYTPLFQVPNTRNYNRIMGNANNSETRFYNAMTLNFFDNENLNNIDINFIYQGQEIYSKIHPSIGELIKPKTTTYNVLPLLPSRNINEYRFFYDVSYPIIVEIRDNTEKNHPYTFLFALEANVKDNLNLVQWWNESSAPLYWDRDNIKRIVNDPLVGLDIPIQTSQGQARNYAYKPRNPEKSFFCNPEQRISGEIKIKTKDASIQQYIDDVEVIYGCGNYMSCNLGLTKHNLTQNLSIFADKLPICLNGYIELRKEGYFTKRLKLTTEENAAKDLGTVNLEPIITKNITAKKKILSRDKQGRIILNNTFNYDLGENDKVIISLTRIPQDNLDEQFSRTIIFGKDVIFNETTVDLTPGRYVVEAQLLDYNGVYIYKECKCVQRNILGECTQRIPSENINITPAVWGGVEFTSQNPIIISRNDLLSNKSLEFYVFRLPNPRCIDDMQDAGDIAGITSRNRQLLLPRFK